MLPASAMTTLSVNLQPPIHKLPPEILCQIFITSGIRNIITSARHRREISGFNIAAVCSYWRSVALTTIELWNSVCLAANHHLDDSQDYALVMVLQRLLALSAESALFVSFEIMDPTPRIPRIFHLLFDQSHRWQTLSVVCVPSPCLQFISKLTLDSLLAFELTTLQPLTDLNPLKAPKLHKLSLNLVESKTSFIPWSQITDLTIQKSYIPQILKVLPRMLNLSKLNCRVSRKFASDRFQPLVKSDLSSLAVSFSDEQAMQLFFDAVLLPNLTSLTLTFTSVVYSSVTEEKHWSRTTLPSLLTRSGSSTILTSFTLHKTQIHPTGLTSLLNLMPNLKNLSFYEKFDDFGHRVINHLLSTLTLQNSSESGLVPNLTFLFLEIHCSADSDFNITILFDLITSRPNLRTVSINVPRENLSLSDSTIASFVDLQKGMDVRIEDAGGDVLFTGREQRGK